jgi:hypothetical protein
MDLKGFVVAVLWQASQLLVFLTSPWHKLAVKQFGVPPLKDPAGEFANRARFGAARFGVEGLWQLAHTGALFWPVFV